MSGKFEDDLVWKIKGEKCLNESDACVSVLERVFSVMQRKSGLAFCFCDSKSGFGLYLFLL